MEIQRSMRDGLVILPKKLSVKRISVYSEYVNLLYINRMTKMVPDKCSSCPKFKNSLFSPLKSQNVEYLDDNFNFHMYKKGQTIFHQGTKPLGIYCVYSGIVKLVRYGRLGHRTIIRIASSGSALGYRSFFANESYTGTAEVVEDAGICFFEGKVIKKLLKSDYGFVNSALKKLARDLRSAEDRFEHMTEYPLRERLAELLVVFKEHYGTHLEDNRDVLNIQLSRKELAEILGATSESIIRQLSLFKKEKLIFTNQTRIVLLDEKKLRQIGHLD